MNSQAERPAVQAQLAGGTQAQEMLFSSRELGLTDPWADLLDDLRLGRLDQPPAA